MKTGIISLGEALIDFIPLDQGNITFQKCPGGAPANVAVGLARLGAETIFLGKVGDDVLGNFLTKTLSDYGVNTDYMYLSRDNRTGVVFVTLDDDGERSFDFYIDPSADRFLTETEVEETLFKQHNVFHFGSISMIDEPSKSATEKAISLAKEHGLLISYDPNLRLGLWKTERQAYETIIAKLSEADIVKISEEELAFITNEKDIQAGAAKLKEYEIPLLYVTAGGEGSHVFYKDNYFHVPAVKVDAVDTTGAGDAFVSALLYQFSERQQLITDYSNEEIISITEFASVSGALAASTKGAMSALPTLTEVQKYFA